MFWPIRDSRAEIFNGPAIHIVVVLVNLQVVGFDSVSLGSAETL